MILSYFFLPILEHRAKIQKYFRLFLVQMKTLKFASEIYWPLGMSCEQLATIILTRVIWHLTKQRIIIKVHFFQISCKDREASFYHPESRFILGRILSSGIYIFLFFPCKVLIVFKIFVFKKCSKCCKFDIF